jgi:hypothetical protein
MLHFVFRHALTMTSHGSIGQVGPCYESALPAFVCRGTHDDYEQKGYTFHLTKQTVDDAAITEVITLPVRSDMGLVLLVTRLL